LLGRRDPNILAHLFGKIQRPLACRFQILYDFRRLFFTGGNLSLSDFTKYNLSLWRGVLFVFNRPSKFSGFFCQG
jgi:hypothetical protein